MSLGSLGCGPLPSRPWSVELGFGGFRVQDPLEYLFGVFEGRNMWISSGTMSLGPLGCAPQPCRFWGIELELGGQGSRHPGLSRVRASALQVLEY